jgi:hypothetical protein
VLCALGVLVAGGAAAASAQAAPNIATAAADWTAVGANTASGTVLGTSVSLAGSHVWPTPTSRVDGSWPYFDGPTFSPALARSDEIQISGGTGYAYTLRFGAPVTDPILHLASLASQVTFPSGTVVTKLSGDPDFTVAGTAVRGAVDPSIRSSGNSDASGTIKLTGTYTAITFTASQLYTGPEDGILVQLVVQPPFTDWTSVGANTASGTLLATSVSLSGSHVWPTPTSRVDESWPYFDGPTFSPALARSDEIQISGGTGYAYTLRFGAPVTDPILELGSLASQITFPAGTVVTKLGGELGLTVAGNVVRGRLDPTIRSSGNSDASGTIKLAGTYAAITFTANQLYAGPEDGILVQVGAARR